jgi:hypothetical protein
MIAIRYFLSALVLLFIPLFVSAEGVVSAALRLIPTI